MEISERLRRIFPSISLTLSLHSKKISHLRKWLEIKENISNGQHSVLGFLVMVFNNCKIPSNRNLRRLKRSEGGLGGDSNTTDKQISFNDGGGETLDEISTINIDIFDSDDGNSKWTFEELKDLIEAFIETVNNIIGEDVCRGYIKLTD